MWKVSFETYDGKMILSDAGKYKVSVIRYDAGLTSRQIFRWRRRAQ